MKHTTFRLNTLRAVKNSFKQVGERYFGLELVDVTAERRHFKGILYGVVESGDRETIS